MRLITWFLWAVGCVSRDRADRRGGVPGRGYHPRVMLSVGLSHFIELLLTLSDLGIEDKGRNVSQPNLLVC